MVTYRDGCFLPHLLGGLNCRPFVCVPENSSRREGAESTALSRKTPKTSFLYDSIRRFLILPEKGYAPCLAPLQAALRRFSGKSCEKRSCCRSGLDPQSQFHLCRIGR